MPHSPIPPTAGERRLHRMLESTDAGICAVDAQGCFTFVNGAGADRLGYHAEDLIGEAWHVIHPTRERTTMPEDCPVCLAVQSRESFRGLSATFRHRDAAVIPVSYSVAPIAIRDGGGAAISFSVSTDLGRMEQKLRELSEELAETERRKTEFIAILAHELRNPLAPICNALEMMRKASNNAASMAHLRGIMERQSGHLVHLVNDLLDIARVTSGQLTLKKEHVALREILEVALEASAPLRESVQNSFTLTMPPETLVLYADVTRLAQAFTNILDNAARYSARGGRTSVNVERDGGKVRTDIADIGIGIAPEALNRIFDMFTRVGREPPGTHAGLGIGLNLARRLVRMHDGELVASSDGLGRGSHFIVTLPLTGTAGARYRAGASVPRGAVLGPRAPRP